MSSNVNSFGEGCGDRAQRVSVSQNHVVELVANMMCDNWIAGRRVVVREAVNRLNDTFLLGIKYKLSMIFVGFVDKARYS